MQCSQRSMNLNNRKIDILFSRDLGYGYCYFTVPLTFVRGVVGCLFGCLMCRLSAHSSIFWLTGDGLSACLSITFIFRCTRR